MSENRYFHCDSGAIVFPRLGDASEWCQSEHCPPFCCATSAQLPLCALRKQLRKKHNKAQAVKRAHCSWTLPSFRTNDGTVSETSHCSYPYRGYATFSQDGVHPPFGWTILQIPLSLPPFQLPRESYELPLLTRSVQGAWPAVSGKP